MEALINNQYLSKDHKQKIQIFKVLRYKFLFLAKLNNSIKRLKKFLILFSLKLKSVEREVNGEEETQRLEVVEEEEEVEVDLFLQTQQVIHLNENN